ncbi:metal-dependent hydrolase [Halopenitus sp. POP-27]|uniref:metal-dependent hydrolase n=1 Tax=Halopenitus sp. POP-27 TaxID=2994425 RepID=UPI0024687E77|nr:metal-dependent hydrolase [Halopenitus sp. POP-27]
MQTTHVLVGMAIAAPIAVQFPEIAGVVLLAGLVGGAFPDLDLYKGHRRTLHFPVLYAAAAVAIGVAATVSLGGVGPAPTARVGFVSLPDVVVTSTPALIALAVGFAAAAAHCLMDVLGGGLELRPWEGRDDRAVYDHVRGRWIAPKRWIRYDGSPEDLAIAAAAGVPVLLVADGVFETLAVGLLGVSAVYVTVRRRLPGIAAALAARVPASLRGVVPDRYLE